MSLAAMFASLGAELNNVRWSWGSVRETDCTVFLRVWQDGTLKIEGKRYIWVADEVPPTGDLGGNERLKHVNLILSGKRCFLVMCQAVDSQAAPRQVQSFNEKEVFVGGDIIRNEGSYWIECLGRIPIRQALMKNDINSITTTP